jgi:lysine-specific demethylase 8
VDSEEGTLAVNFWWEGATSRQLGGHMDRFYLRRLLQSLLEKQKQAALAALPRCDLLHLAAEADAGVAASSEEGQPLPQQLGPPEQAAALQLLAAAVTEHQQAGAGRPPPAVIGAVVATLAALSAQALLSVLLRLRRLRPQLAAHLLLHSLGPAGWELLSGCIERRQEELAAAGEDRCHGCCAMLRCAALC